eukprot:4237588-Pleurochrysis_carterae.AAC.3
MNVRATHTLNETAAATPSVGLSNRRFAKTARSETVEMRSRRRASAGRKTRRVYGSTAPKLAIGMSVKTRISIGSGGGGGGEGASVGR